ncbi:hypothetical protein ACFYMO_16700 [Streptomyces sp. NPDC007025]|uniref:hypothetical protein n=1 Tax=Streptomyces sp. NPDC007025 TaxID=3364771 RepID=UPI0036919A0A
MPSLVQAERIIGGTPKAIEEQAGWAWEDGQDLVGARVATDEEAEFLGIRSRPAALFVGYSSLFDAEGRIEYDEYRSDGNRLTRYTCARPHD